MIENSIHTPQNTTHLSLLDLALSKTQQKQSSLKQLMDQILTKVIQQEFLKTKNIHQMDNTTFDKRAITEPQHIKINNIESEYNTQQQKKRMAIQQRRNSINIKRIQRQAYLDQMKKINSNYCKFIKQLKKVKPLYQIKQEEFQIASLHKFQVRRQKALSKLKQYYKPVNFEEIKEHEKRYLLNKLKKQQFLHHNPEDADINCFKKQIPRKRHQAQLQEFNQLKEKLKQKECESVLKMKQYCQKVLQSVKDRMSKYQKRHRQRSQTQPFDLQKSTINEKNRALSRPVSYYKKNKILQSAIPFRKQNDFSSIQTIPNKTKCSQFQASKNRYFIGRGTKYNQNGTESMSKDQKLIRRGKKNKVDKTSLPDDYVDSVSQKIKTFSTKS